MKHDSGYHLLFSHPHMVEDLLKSFVDRRWVDQLDFTTLERVNAKLHAEGMERRDGDIIYRVCYHNGQALYLYLLLEFQSQADRWMPLRVIVYTCLLYQHLVRENQLTAEGRLPPVFPLVLYNGDSPWSTPCDLHSLIALPQGDELWAWQPQMRYYLLEERRYPKGRAGSINGILFELENCRQPEALADIVERLIDLLADPAHASLKRAFNAWIRQVLLPAKTLTIMSSQADELSEVKQMLSSRIEQWQKEWLEQGIERGIEQGIEQGRLDGEATLLRQLLQRRFGPLPEWVEDKLRHAQRELIEEWGLKLLDATSLTEIFESQ